MATINQALQPGFTIEVVRGTNPTIVMTVYDRSGNVFDLTGYTVKLAARQFFRVSNGLGQLTLKPFQLFDVTATIISATLGNLSFALPASQLGKAGSFELTARFWNGGSTQRMPDDAYSGALSVATTAVRSEA